MRVWQAGLFVATGFGLVVWLLMGWAVGVVCFLACCGIHMVTLRYLRRGRFMRWGMLPTFCFAIVCMSVWTGVFLTTSSSVSVHAQSPDGKHEAVATYAERFNVPGTDYWLRRRLRCAIAERGQTKSVLFDFPITRGLSLGSGDAPDVNWESDGSAVTVLLSTHDQGRIALTAEVIRSAGQ